MPTHFMETISATLISILAFAIVMLVALLLLALKKRFTQQFKYLEQKVVGQELMVEELQTLLMTQQSQLEEYETRINELMLDSEQVSKHLEHRIKMHNEQLSKYESKLEQISSQQPEDKLYSRALKLVALGADIEEVMSECEIPRAEAEMLLAVHRQKAQSN